MKCLPFEFLKEEFQITELKKDGISMPYIDEHGTIRTYKERRAGKRFRYTPGATGQTTPYLYAIKNNLELIRNNNKVVLVEGESDTQTLTYAGIPVIGIPGSCSFQDEWVESIVQLNVDIYIHLEPDVGGLQFKNKVLTSLIKNGFKRQVYTFTVYDQRRKIKDPSEMWIRHYGIIDKVDKYLKNMNPEDGYTETRALYDYKTAINKLIESAVLVDFRDIKSLSVSGLVDPPIYLIIPEEYQLKMDGIYYIGGKSKEPELICTQPILITKKLKSVETSEEKVELAFYRNDEKIWDYIICDRAEICQASRITQKSQYGLAVTSENSKRVIEYLYLLEWKNNEILKITKSLSRLGWYKDNFLPYCSGEMYLDIESKTKWENTFEPRGDIQEWIDFMKPKMKNDYFRFMLSGSAVAPLSSILHVRVMFEHLWGKSRFGKTATLKAALSMWGNPLELMINFNTTQVGLERTLSMYSDMFVGMDETQILENNKPLMYQLVYIASGSRGKTRGKLGGGVQEVASWQCQIGSTGENPMTDIDTAGGITSRTMEIQGIPLASEEEASEVHEFVESNYGHIGRKYIECLVKNIKEERTRMKDLYKDVTNRLQMVYKGKISSQLKFVAAMVVADIYLKKWVYDDPDMKESLGFGMRIAGEMIDAADVDEKEQIYESLKGWCIENHNSFLNKEMGKSYGDYYQGVYYIIGSTLIEELKRRNLNSKKVFLALKDNNHLRLHKNTVGYQFNRRNAQGQMVKYYALIVDREEFERTNPNSNEDVDELFYNDMSREAAKAGGYYDKKTRL